MAAFLVSQVLPGQVIQSSANTLSKHMCIYIVGLSCISPRKPTTSYFPKVVRAGLPRQRFPNSYRNTFRACLFAVLKQNKQSLQRNAAASDFPKVRFARLLNTSRRTHSIALLFEIAFAGLPRQSVQAPTKRVSKLFCIDLDNIA